MTPFAATIKAIRLERKLTQKQMAKLLSMTDRNYQYYEAGTREPTLETFLAITDTLGISSDYLLGRSNRPDIVHFDSNGKPYIVEAMHPHQ